MKTYQEISKEEIDKFIKQGYNDKPIGFDEHVAKLYAQQVAEDVRQRCSDNAELVPEGHFNGFGGTVDKETILNTEIILP